MSKSDPRIAPKEMIVTRFKSAQQKRQLRDKDRSMTKVTQLLKSSPQKKMKKMPKSPRKEKREPSPVIPDDCNSKDYYPEKQKRAFAKRKAFLAPKHQMTTVARTNKRKFNTPKKNGMKSPPSTVNRNPSPDWTRSSLSMEEAVRLVEDTDSLDEDDLMEILTCPSPVWWEPHPLYGYMEEPISQQDPDESSISQESGKDSETSKKDSELSADNKERILDTDCLLKDSDLKVDGKKDERFIKKSKKLENVLGNIKNKALITKEEVKMNAQCKTDDKKDCNDSAEIHKTKDLKVLTEKESEKAEDEIKDTTKQVKSKNTMKAKKLSESTEEDMAELNFTDDNMLLNLENMDIPIGNPLDKSPSSESVIIVNDDELCNKASANRSLIYLVDISGNEKNSTAKLKPIIDDNITNKVIDIEAEELKIELLNDINEICNNNCDDSDNTAAVDKEQVVNVKSVHKIDETNSNGDNSDSMEVPKDLPPLKKRPKYETSANPSPVSLESATDDTIESSNLPGQEELDTISDTNINLIMDDIDMTVTNKNVIEEEDDMEKYIMLNKDANDDLKSNADPYVTVYKLIPNKKKTTLTNKFKNIPEYSNHVQNLKKADTNQDTSEDSSVKVQLNSFFKKCKNAYRKKCKSLNRTVDSNPISDVDSMCDSCDPKTSMITVAREENIKYCFKCSSIFDTDECRYCLISVKESKLNSVCNVCEFVGDSSSIQTHMEEHNRDNT